MKLSICYISNRPGSIDLLSHTFITQDNPGDHELVVVDGFKGRPERGIAKQVLENNKINLGWYGPARPKTFPWARTGFVNAMNTGLLHCKGDYVVFMHDFVVLPPDAIRLWRAVFDGLDGKTLVSGIGMEYTTPKPDGIDDIRTWEKYPQWTFSRPWMPTDFEVGYWGGPLSFFDLCNGIDARADFNSTWALNCVKAQTKIHGYSYKMENNLVCHMIDHRAWDTHIGMDSMYKTFGTFSDVPEEPVWSAWSCNSFNLSRERG